MVGLRSNRLLRISEADAVMRWQNSSPCAFIDGVRSASWQERNICRDHSREQFGQLL